jgi:predicted alpha/beta hydrolase family esterase
MSQRLILIPRWGAGPDSEWYPWLQRQLAAAPGRPFDPVVIADMPHAELPTIAAWTERVGALLGSDAGLNSRTVLAGHSLGCQAVLRALADLPEATRVAGLFLVAGWFTIDRPWDTLLPWIQTPLDLPKVRGMAGKTVVLISNNDHLTHDWVSSRQLWEQRMGAQVIVVEGADHFNGQECPAILQALLGCFRGDENHVVAHEKRIGA